MKILKKFWRPALAISLILILIKKGPFDVNQLRQVLSQPSVLGLGLGIFFFQVLIFAVRWKLFVSLVTKLPFAKSMQFTLIGLFFNFFIPGGVGGDIIKALELSKEGDITRSQAISTVMSDRIFGLFAMITFSSIFLSYEFFLQPSEYLLKFGSISLLMFASMVIALLFMPAIFKKLSTLLSGGETGFFEKLNKLIDSLHFTFVTFRNMKVQLKSLTLSFISQLISIYYMYVVVTSLGVQPPSFLVFFSLCCFGFVASALPIMPGGIGVGQYAFYALFMHMGEPAGKAIITAITALQLFTLLYALVGGVIFSLNPKVKEDLKEYEKTESVTSN